MSYTETLIDGLGKMNILTGSFVGGHNGEQVYYKKIFHNEVKPKFHILFLHDFLDYHGRYEPLAHLMFDYFNGECSIGLLDFHGHGLSNGMRGHISSFESLEDELRFYLKNCVEEDEVFVMASGLGATVTLSLEISGVIQKRSLTGLILANPLLKMNITIPPFIRQLIDKNTFGVRKVKMSFPFNGHDLIDDKQKAEEYDSDPLVSGQFSLASLFEIGDAAKRLRSHAYYLSTPTLFLGSDQDYLSDIQTLRMFYKSMKKDKTSLFEFRGVKHDLFNSKVVDEYFATVIKWIKEKSQNV